MAEQLVSKANTTEEGLFIKQWKKWPIGAHTSTI
jgi:hypothetical protein